MIKKNHIMYWSPSLVNIATNKAVLNSALSLGKYSNNYEYTLLNFFGEFNPNKAEIDKNGGKIINHFSSFVCKLFASSRKVEE